MDLGLEEAGFEIRVQVDRDRWCVRTLSANRRAFRSEPVVLQEDVRLLTPSQLVQRAGLKDVVLICAGPPCQSFSLAGRRQGLRDPRGLLVYEFVRILEALRPALFLFENVPGFVSESTRISDWLIEQCRAAGYGVSAGILDASEYGAPQRRRRWILLGCRAGCPPALPRPTHGPKGSTPYVTLRDALRGLERPDLDGAVEFSPKTRDLLSLVPAGGDWRDLPEPLRLQVSARWQKRGGKTSFYRRLHWDAPAPTVSTKPDRPMACLCHPDETRPLTVREVARLQGFPDWWVFEGPVTARYRQIGEAVPVQLAKALGSSLAAHLQELGREPCIAASLPSARGR